MLDTKVQKAWLSPLIPGDLIAAWHGVNIYIWLFHSGTSFQANMDVILARNGPSSIGYSFLIGRKSKPALRNLTMLG